MDSLQFAEGLKEGLITFFVGWAGIFIFYGPFVLYKAIFR